VRVSGYESHDGGYIDNPALGQATSTSRTSMVAGIDALFTPTDALSIRINAFAQNITRDGIGDRRLHAVGSAGGGQQLGAAAPDRGTVGQRTRLVAGTLTYDFGPAALSRCRGYQTKTEFVGDLSRGYVPLLQSRWAVPTARSA